MTKRITVQEFDRSNISAELVLQCQPCRTACLLTNYASKKRLEDRKPHTALYFGTIFCEAWLSSQVTVHSRYHAKDGNIKNAAQLTGVGPFWQKSNRSGNACFLQIWTLRNERQLIGSNAPYKYKKQKLTKRSTVPSPLTAYYIYEQIKKIKAQTWIEVSSQSIQQIYKKVLRELPGYASFFTDLNW